jgi:hypothetical protein
LATFELEMASPTEIQYYDYLVEHGQSYVYAIQEIRETEEEGMVLSARETIEPIQVFFEDMFLFDGENQLKIKFNPKVTSLKNTMLEAKQDAIGSKYPYFFRNGNVCYKEFPISGLVSY